jgi:putative transposase
VFDLPPSHRRRLRTRNLLERLNEEIKRRTRVARLFPNEASCLRLVSEVLMEISDDWQTADKRYVVFEAAMEAKPKLQNECCLIFDSATS